MTMTKENLSYRAKKLLGIIEFDSNEEIVCEIRKHPFGLLLIYLSGGLISIVLFLVMVALPIGVSDSALNLTVNTGAIRSIFIITGLVLVLLSVFMTAIAAFLYQNNVVLVTNEKVAQQEYKSIFNKKISQLTIGDVQDVTVIQRGLFARIFGYGTLIIETAGEQNNYLFTYSVDPYECSKMIVSTHEAFIEKYGN
jgi:uncharacterized membrane protein YdbT with pleckstrin-like domain